MTYTNLPFPIKRGKGPGDIMRVPSHLGSNQLAKNYHRGASMNTPDYASKIPVRRTSSVCTSIRIFEREGICYAHLARRDNCEIGLVALKKFCTCTQILFLLYKHIYIYAYLNIIT